jgi:hypothetical protein
MKTYNVRFELYGKKYHIKKQCDNENLLKQLIRMDILFTQINEIPSEKTNNE